MSQLNRANSRGIALEERLQKAVAELKGLPAAGSRLLPVINGVTSTGIAEGNLENVLVEVEQIIINSNRMYAYGNGIVLEKTGGDENCLVSLANGNQVEKCASAILANLFVCEKTTEDGPRQFLPPEKLVQAVLLREPTQKALPRIKTYSLRPIFDQHFRWCGPGWHADEGILVHGPDVPIELPPKLPDKPTGKLIDTLPPHLSELLRDFCFASDADLANAVGVLITGLLINHFIEQGHPLILLDGNQPGVGKTLLARTIGTVLDGCDPRLITYTPDDDALEKRLLSTIRGGRQNCLIIDNAKTRAGKAISSPVIEANCVAAEISLRILGKSENYTRPNDLLWFITMNDTKVSPDLVSRCLPNRFRFEGDPRTRNLGNRNPVGYAIKNRVAILGELAGMVKRWDQAGRPMGAGEHRLHLWASTVGGIMQANGLPQFLTNLETAAAEFNTELDDLTALAETALANNGPAKIVRSNDNAEQHDSLILAKGRTAAKWSDVFIKAGVLQDRLEAAKSDRAKARFIGDFLGKYVDREIDLMLEEGKAVARLRKIESRSRSTLYCFEVELEKKVEEVKEPTPSRLSHRRTDFSRGRSIEAEKEGGARSNPLKPSVYAAGNGKPAVVVTGGNQEAW